MKETKHKDTKM